MLVTLGEDDGVASSLSGVADGEETGISVGTSVGIAVGVITVIGYSDVFVENFDQIIYPPRAKIPKSKRISAINKRGDDFLTCGGGGGATVETLSTTGGAVSSVLITGWGWSGGTCAVSRGVFTSGMEGISDATG